MFDARLLVTKLAKQNSVNNTWETLFPEIKSEIELELNMDFKFRNPFSRVFVKTNSLKKRKTPLLPQNKSHFLLRTLNLTF